MNPAEFIQTLRGIRRRVQGVIGRGRVTACDDSDGIQRLQVSLNPGEVRDGTPNVQHYGFTSSPPPGTDVLAAFVDGDRSNGAVIGTNNRRFRKKGLAAGDSAMYDAAGKFVHLSAAGLVINAQGQPVVIQNASSVTITAATEIILDTPVLKVTGDVIDRYQDQVNNMASMRQIFNAHTHKDVQPGSGDSGPPNQQE